MATDVNLIVKNVVEFYDFTGKKVILVGAGGGRLLDYIAKAKHVVALDSDSSAIESFKKNLSESPYAAKVEALHADFYECDISGDIVFFEMCLHEMKDAALAIERARKMAREVVVLDHLPGKWTHYTAETEIVERSWRAIRSAGIKREREFLAIQLFADYKEIFEKLKQLGEPAVSRMDDFKNAKNFTIPMPYAIAVI